MKILKVHDANYFVNDTSKHGLASEVTCPTIAAIMSDYKALGMIGSVELFSGFDKLESTVKWTYPDNDAQKAFANFLKPLDIMVRSNRVEYEGGAITEEVPVVIYMRGNSKQFQGGTFKTKEDTELENTVSLTYFKLEVDGEEIIEVDVLNNIYKVDGVDLLATRRENLGIS